MSEAAEVSAPTVGPRIEVGVYDLDAPPSEIDLRGPAAWRFLVVADDRPLASVDMPSPDGVVGREFLQAAVAGRAMHPAIRERLISDLADRMGVTPTPVTEETRPAVTVVVCTHGRPAHLPRCLAALRALDPAADEVIVVDNDPGPDDARGLVEESGFRYLREDRRGLDNARNAGVRAASGEIVMFTDDDCVPAPHWLRRVPEMFADPSVAAVTGPMFPLALETKSQVLMEAVAGMGRGFWRQAFDWRTISPVHAAAVGVGANMGFRRSVLAGLGDEPFPCELDAGTPTESGGDTYVIAKVIALGHRIVYTPEIYGFHDHRGDTAALQKAIRGYGIGISAAMCKLLVEDHELDVWRGWAWLVTQHVRAQRRRVAGRMTSAEVRSTTRYITGGLLGPRRWRRSLAEQRRMRGEVPGSQAAPLPGPDASPMRVSPSLGADAITVIIPTRGRLESLARCLDSLQHQTVAADQFTVLIVDDNPTPGTLDALTAQFPGLTLRVVRSDGGGASSARNLGAREAQTPLLLFIDDDMVAGSTLLECHRRSHGGPGPIAVVGAYWPCPPRPGLMASAVGLWWSETFESMRLGGRPTFNWMLSGNLSIPREAFLAVGGFPDDIPYRREDWDLGMRWLQAGHDIRYSPGAGVRHEFSQRTEDRVRAAELEGFGDATLSAKYPGSAGVLPLIGHRPLTRTQLVRRLAHAALRTAAIRRVGLGVLNRVEAAHLRATWMRGLAPLQSSAYKQGLERADRSTARTQETVVRCELLDRTPFGPQGPVAPTVEVTLDGEHRVHVRPYEGFWNARVADQIAYALSDVDLERIAAHRGWAPLTEPPRARPPRVQRVVAEASLTPTPGAQSAEFIALLDHEPAPEGERWLTEALTALEGTKLAAVFGSAVDDRRPLQPIYLHDAARPPALHDDHFPTYVLVRAEALASLRDRLDGDRCAAPEVILALIDAGEVVGRRDVHGLGEGPARPLARGRALGVARRTWGEGSAAVLLTVPVVLGWDIYKRRGRIPLGRLMFDTGQLWGAAQGAWSRRRVSRPGSV